MKKSLCIIAYILAISLLSFNVHIYAAEDNSKSSGAEPSILSFNFEQGQEKYFTGYSSTDILPAITAETVKDAPSGTHCLSVIPKAANDIVAFNVPFEYGKTYAITAKMKVQEGTASFSPRVYRADRMPNIEPLTNGQESGKLDTAWKEVKFEYQCWNEGPYGTDINGDVQFMLATASARYMIDDIRVYEAASDNLIYNWYYRSFEDIQDHWAKDAITKMAFEGMVNGVSQTAFMPDNTITRAEFTAITVNMFVYSKVRYDGTIPDIEKNAWYADPVFTALEKGYIDEKLMDDGFVLPLQNITREEMASIIINVYKSFLGNKDFVFEKGKFSDLDQVSEWARDYVSGANSLEIITGTPEGKFLPKSNATRAEAVVMLTRLKEAVNNIKLRETFIEFGKTMEAKLRTEGMIEKADGVKADMENFIKNVKVKRENYRKAFLTPVKDFYNNPYVKAILLKCDANRESGMFNMPLYVNRNGIDKWIPVYTSSYGKANSTIMMLWLFATPESPYFGDANLLSNILKAIESMSHSGDENTGSLDEIYKSDPNYDHFFYDLYTSIYDVFSKLYPCFVLPTLDADCKTTIAKATDNLIKVYGAITAGHYQNIDILYINILYNAGEILHNEAYKKEGDRLVTRSMERMYPDGGTPYIFSEAETSRYHANVVSDFAKVYFHSGNKLARQFFEKEENYYPLTTDNTGISFAGSELAPWKNVKTTVIDLSHSMGPMISAYFSKNKETAKIAKKLLLKDPSCLDAKIDALINQAICWSHELMDIGDITREDNYITVDRNINGYRGKFGHFTFMGDTLDRRYYEPLLTERSTIYGDGMSRGRFTQVGAIITDEQDGFAPINSILYKVNTAVNFGATLSEQYQANGAAITNDSCIVTDDFATQSTSYTFSEGQKKDNWNLPGWVGKQAWYSDKNRMIGYVAVDAETDKPANFAIGRMLFGSLKSAYVRYPETDNKKLEKISGNIYKYGKFVVRIVSTNYETVQMKDNTPLILLYAYRSQCPVGSILSFTNSSGNLMKKGDRKYFLVEVYPEWSEPSKNINMSTLPQGVVKIDITENMQKQCLMFNTTDKKVNFELTFGSYVYSANGHTATKVEPVSLHGKVEIEPFSHVLIK